MEQAVAVKLWHNSTVEIALEMEKLRDAIVKWDWNGKLDSSVPRRTCADLMKHLVDEYWLEVEALTKDFDSRSQYPDRPMIQLSGLTENEPSVWLLGWRAGEQTPIHDHADSEVGIHVFEGSVTEHIYVPSKFPLGEGEETDFRKVSRELMEGSTVRITSPYVHLFTKTCIGTECVHATTIHCYWPRLLAMNLFNVDEEKQRITYKGTWKDEG